MKHLGSPFIIMRKKNIRVGDVVIVKNSKPHSAANPSYAFMVVRESGKEVQLMLTMAEYTKSMARAGKNPEDCIKRHTVVRPRKRGFMAWLRGR